MDFHHVVEAAGIVALGLVFYSYARRWLESTGRIDRIAQLKRARGESPAAFCMRRLQLKIGEGALGNG